MVRKHKIFGEKSLSPAPKSNSNIEPTKDKNIKNG
jgi:hypothetical protein